MKRLLLLALLIGLPSYAGDISASYSNSNFEEEFYVDRLDSIEMWEQPKTKYTPKNLRTEQQMRFNGKEGTNSYNSYTLHLTDYDTYITESYFKDGKFYVKDNLGQSFQTGELQEIDTSALETAIQTNATNISNNTESINQLSTKVDNNTTAIQNNTTNINKNTESINKLDTRVTNNTVNIEKNRQDIRNLDGRVTTNTNNIEVNKQNIQTNAKNISTLNTKVDNNTTRINQNAQAIQTNANNIQRVNTQVQANTGNINALKQNVSRLDSRMGGLENRVDKLNTKMEQGLATVSALAGLHPNPRHTGKTQVAVSAGMYKDNVAGAVGVFHYLNDRVMLSAGAAYGGDTSWAGNVGITIGF